MDKQPQPRLENGRTGPTVREKLQEWITEMTQLLNTLSEALAGTIREWNMFLDMGFHFYADNPFLKRFSRRPLKTLAVIAHEFSELMRLLEKLKTIEVHCQRVSREVGPLLSLSDQNCRY